MNETFTHPELTVQEVAYRVGFNNAHNFHKLYRETYGETPRGMQTAETEDDWNSEWRRMTGMAFPAWDCIAQKVNYI